MHWERNYCNVACDAEPIAEVYERVHREVTADDNADDAANWCVPYGSRRCGEGVVIDLTDHPRWAHRRRGPIVYQGRLPASLVLNGVHHRLDVTRIAGDYDQPAALGDAVVYGNFDIILDHLPRGHTLDSTPHVPRALIYLVPMLIVC